MKINYLFSGIDKEKGFYDVQSKYLKQDIKENQIITFIASTFDNHEQNIMYKNILLSYNINANKIIFAYFCIVILTFYAKYSILLLHLKECINM